MNQIISIALGGAMGSIFRFFVASAVHQWLGRGFPYGTLTVNVIGSFLIGLLSEALVLQRVAIAMEYRAAVLIGLFGSFTTFSSFSLETLYLLEQGNYGKAVLNILISVALCLVAVWIGLLAGRTLFFYSGGVMRRFGLIVPYAIVAVNMIGAFLIGFIAELLLKRTHLALEHRAAIMIIVFGVFATLSSLYLILYLIEEGYTFEGGDLDSLLSVFVGNAFVCVVGVWCGFMLGKRV